MLFHVRTRGEGTPILFLHGFLGSHLDFIPIIESLANPCIAPDLFGHGQSPSSEEIDFSSIAEAIANLLDEPSHIVGYSMGGRIALALKEHFPHLVKHCFLIGAHPGPAPAGRRAIHAEWGEKLQSLPMDDFIEAWYKQPLFAGSPVPERRKANSARRLAPIFEKLALHHQPNYSHLLQSEPDHFTLIVGERDTKYGELYRGFPKINLKSIPKVGHPVHIEKPETISEIIMSQVLTPEKQWIKAQTYSDILYEKMGGVAKITINRPEVRNAFRPQTVKQMIDALYDAQYDENVGVIILTGAGDLAFCSGGDQRVRKEDGYSDDKGVQTLNVLEFQKHLRSIPKPTIAMVAGYAIGGGHVLHLICDLTIAADNAVFGQTGPRVGSFDGGFGASMLASIVGQKKAREIWYLCRQYSAQEALEMGLVNTVVPLAELEKVTLEWAEQMLEHSPIALRCMKAGFNADLDGQAGIQELAGNATMLFYMSEEAQEGHKAYLNKRKPNFSQFKKRP